MAGCLTRTRFVIVRGVRSPEEANGFLQVAQSEPVRVNVIGTDHVGYVDVSGYAVLNTFDLEQFVKVMKEHQSCAGGGSP